MCNKSWWRRKTTLAKLYCRYMAPTFWQGGGRDYYHRLWPGGNKRQISSAQYCTYEWKDKLNIIDTPGYFDFVGDSWRHEGRRQCCYCSGAVSGVIVVRKSHGLCRNIISLKLSLLTRWRRKRCFSDTGSVGKIQDIHRAVSDTHNEW